MHSFAIAKFVAELSRHNPISKQIQKIFSAGNLVKRFHMFDRITFWRVFIVRSDFAIFKNSNVILAFKSVGQSQADYFAIINPRDKMIAIAFAD